MSPSVDRVSWEAAVRRLYEKTHPFDATGPRRHEDWVLDLLPLMARAVADPRGWSGLDGAARAPERAASPTYPFAVRPPAYIAARLKEIDRGSAENLLLALARDGCSLPGPARSPEGEEELRGPARTVLARYGDGAAFHTNVSRPGPTPGTLDFTTPHWGYSPLSVRAEDYGLVVVSETEVGVFWAFSGH